MKHDYEPVDNFVPNFVLLYRRRHTENRKYHVSIAQLKSIKK